MKITKKEIQFLIKEEIFRYKKIKELENKKNKLINEILILEVGPFFTNYGGSYNPTNKRRSSEAIAYMNKERKENEEANILKQKEIEIFNNSFDNMINRIKSNLTHRNYLVDDKELVKLIKINMKKHGLKFKIF